ncbi:MAG: lysophospholipid acyltransferase family protein [Polyangiaceae bacterium]
MRVFSIAYWAFIALCCVPFFTVALLVFAVTLPFDRRRVVLHLYSCFWAAFYVYANPIWRMRVRGRSKLPWRGPAVIVANHASLIDILVLFALYRPFKWVSKAENFKLPFIGWNMTLNDYVPLVRGNRRSIARMMAECRKHLARGMPVLIFPEGTRTRDGELQEFKDGAFRLAAEAGCPVVPVAVHGTRHSLPPHGAVLRNGMNALVEVLDPIAPDADPDRLREAARQAIAGALARQAGTAPPSLQKRAA